MIHIENDDQEIVATNFFSSEYAQRGLLFVSTNAGTVRVLLPDTLAGYLDEMKTAKRVELERRGQRLILWFDDGTETPFRVDVGAEQVDRLPSDPAGKKCRVTVWMFGPTKVLDLPGRLVP